MHERGVVSFDQWGEDGVEPKTIQILSAWYKSVLPGKLCWIIKDFADKKSHNNRFCGQDYDSCKQKLYEGHSKLGVNFGNKLMVILGWCFVF